jgi:Serine aminopeptidase, S33
VLSGTAAADLMPALDADAPLDLSGFIAPFEPARTGYEWLSRDEAQVDAYVADPLCGFGYDVPGSKAVYAGARAAADPEKVARIRHDLPVYVVVGDQDPVGDQLTRVHALVQRYRDAGLTDVELRVYPGARRGVQRDQSRRGGRRPPAVARPGRPRGLTLPITCCLRRRGIHTRARGVVRLRRTASPRSRTGVRCDRCSG